MSRLIFSGGSKGGVGKSMIAAAFGNYLIDQSEPLTLLEADRTNPDVYRFFASNDITTGEQTIKDVGKDVRASLIDLQEHSGWNSLIRFIETDVSKNQETNRVYLVDLPGGIDEAFEKQIERFARAMKVLNVEMEMIFTLGRSVDSVVALEDVMEYVKKYFVKLYVVKNLFWGEPRKFKRFDKAQVATDVKSFGGIVLPFPEMDDDLWDLVWVANPRRFSVVEHLDLAERMDMETFTESAAKTFQQILARPEPAKSSTNGDSKRATASKG